MKKKVKHANSDKPFARYIMRYYFVNCCCDWPRPLIMKPNDAMTSRIEDNASILPPPERRNLYKDKKDTGWTE
jgi:hypothetical protein